MSDRINNIITAVLVGVIVLVLAFIAFKFFGPKKKEIIQPVTTESRAEKRNFHADSVLIFQWNVGDTNSVFQRSSRMGAWNPNIRPQLIQDRLLVLSELDYQETDLPAASTISISLTFDSHKTWNALWHKDKIVWFSGPLKNKGSYLTKDQLKLFLSGSESFRKQRIDWCPDRPTKIELESADKDFKYVYKNNGWNKDPKISTKVEKWIGQHCTIIVDHFVDPTFADKFVEHNDDYSLEVKFKDNTEVEFEWGDNGLIRMEDSKKQRTYFYSERFLKALNI